MSGSEEILMIVGLKMLREKNAILRNVFCSIVASGFFVSCLFFFTRPWKFTDALPGFNILLAQLIQSGQKIIMKIQLLLCTLLVFCAFGLDLWLPHSDVPAPMNCG